MKSPMRADHPPRFFFGLLALLLVAGLVALVVAAVTDDEEAAVDEEPAPADEDPDPATPTFERVGIDGLEGEVGDVELHDVHGDDLGWVAVGAATDVGAAPRAVALGSLDGEEWTALELPAPEAEHHRASAIARVGDATVVLGHAVTDDGAHPLVWVGTEDEGWELTELGDEVDDVPALAINNATAVGDRAVAVGTLIDGDQRTPAVWLVATDGSAERVDVGVEDGFLRDVAGSDEELLAVGGSEAEGTVLLRSEDQGASWEPVDDLAGLQATEVHALEVDEDGWLAGGRVAHEEEAAAAVWTSPDGAAWDLVNDPGRAGPGSVRAIHRLDGRLVALGTWLHVEQAEDGDDGGLDIFGGQDDTWSEPRWPGPGESGWFGVGAEHDGRVVVVGGVQDAVTDLHTATSPEEWDRIPVGDQLLDRAEGVLSRWVTSLAADGERVVAVGGQVTLGDDIATRGLFAGLAPDFEAAEEPATGPGQLRSVAHVPGTGFVAAGSSASEDFDHAGVRALISDDGEAWAELEVDETDDDDRAQVVLPLDGRVLVAGLTWEDGAPVSYLWELDGEELELLETPGLDGFGVVDGCAGGDVVGLVVFPGDATRLLAVSQDAGGDFNVLGEDPFTTADELACAASPTGELLVVVQGAAGTGLYHFDEDGLFEHLAVELGDSPVVTGATHLPEVGWVVLGTVVVDGERHGRVHVSHDLETWTTGRLETTAEGTRPAHVAVAGGALHVLGSEEDRPTMWRLDLDALPPAPAADGDAPEGDADEAGGEE